MLCFRFTNSQTNFSIFTNSYSAIFSLFANHEKCRFHELTKYFFIKVSIPKFCVLYSFWKKSKFDVCSNPEVTPGPAPVEVFGLRLLTFTWRNPYLWIFLYRNLGGGVKNPSLPSSLQLSTVKNLSSKEKRGRDLFCNTKWGRGKNIILHMPVNFVR